MITPPCCVVSRHGLPAAAAANTDSDTPSHSCSKFRRNRSLLTSQISRRWELAVRAGPVTAYVTVRPYSLTVLVRSCRRACHSFQYFMADQYQYCPELGDGTWYVLWENIRFFKPFRYGAAWVDVQFE
jgi:hypothetical protein